MGCFLSSIFCASFSQGPFIAETAEVKDLQGDTDPPVKFSLKRSLHLAQE